MVGFGLALSVGKDTSNWYWLTVVADYYTPGNYVGQYTANVFPAEITSTTTAVTQTTTTVKTTSANQAATTTAAPSAACMSVSAACQSAFNQQALSATNVYRLKHHVGALALNATIGTLSLDYSCQLASTFTFAHNANRGNLGENLYAAMSTATFDLSATSCARKLRNLSYFKLFPLYSYSIKEIAFSRI